MDVVLHKIEPIVTADRFECGVHRMAVPGGWIYWLTPPGAVTVGTFVPEPARQAADEGARAASGTEEEPAGVAASQQEPADADAAA